jgi:small GTP-binding protein
MTVEEEIRRIEEELARTKYNKATQKHIGILKSKLAKLREEQQKLSKGKAGLGYGVRKSGDATVIIVGFPSVGKSSLLNRITRADSRVGDYDFTTLEVIPGVLEHNGARIQVLDIPGVIEGVSGGKGRGREVLSVARNADLLLILVDATREAQLDVIRKELQEAGFRINQRPPDVAITKRIGGGIDVTTSDGFRLSKETIKSILMEFKVHNADVVVREDVAEEQLIDCLMRNRVYIPAVVAFNKTDLLPEGGLAFLRKRYPDALFVSAARSEGLDSLKEAIWRGLGLMRIYLKRIGREPDMREPFIMRRGSTVKDIADSIHKRVFGERVRYARIWGRTAKFPGQKRGIETRLQDGDIVELHA